jgi:hypothetical protein
VGYPSHWIASIVEDMLGNVLTAAATAPLLSPDVIPSTEPPVIKHDLSAYLLDLQVALSISAPSLLPFGISWEVRTV